MAVFQDWGGKRAFKGGSVYRSAGGSSKLFLIITGLTDVLSELLKFLGRRAGDALTRRRAPSLSVGMAAHGNARTTRRALDSLFSSATGDFELVLVDDQSPDDTL
jgi:hypothetical protein